METPTPGPPSAPPSPSPSGSQTVPPPLPFSATTEQTATAPIRLPDTTPRRDPQEFLTGKNLFRVGLGLLLLGLAFLLRYAIDQDWIGEGARIAAGVGTSGALLGLGLRISNSRPTYGELLQGGGVAGLYLTVFAAHRLYDMIDETTTTVFLGGVSALGIGLAIRAISERLAIVSVLGAVVAPIIATMSFYVDVIDAVYLGVVMAGAVVLYARNEWNLLFWVTQAGVSAVALASVLFAQGEGGIGVQMVLGFMWVAFVAIPASGLLLGTVQDQTPAIFGTVITSLTLGVASWALWANEVSAGVLATGATVMSLVHVLMAYEMRAKGHASLSELQLVPASVFLAGAILLMFDGPAATFALAVEGFAIALAGRRMENELTEYLGHGVFGMASSWLMLRMILVGPEGTPLFNVTAMSRVAVIGLAIGLAVFYDRMGDRATDDMTARIYASAAYLSSLVFFWVELAPVSQGFVSTAWGVLGVGAVVIGTVGSRKVITKVGVGTLLGVAVKLFLVDFASADPILRIALFFGFGIALLAVGYWMSTDD